MNLLRRMLLILAIISSLFSDIIPGLTSIVVLLLIVLSSAEVYRNKKKIKINKYYIIIFINIFAVMMSMMLNYNSMSFKYIIYLVSLVFIMETTKIKDIEYIFKTITLASILASLYIIIVGSRFDSTNLDFVNVRQDIILQKQSVNIIFNIIMPYTLIKIFKEKEKKYIFPLILYVISGVIVLQIKTFFITIPAGFLFIELLKGKINFNKVIKLSIMICISIFIIYKIDLIKQFTPIIDYIIYGEKSIYIGSKHLETLLLRREIIYNCIEVIKGNLLLGIGYGNYINYMVGKVFYSSSKGIYIDLPPVTESGVLNFIVEGGIIGFILHSILIFNIIKDIKYCQKRNNSFLLESVFIAFICMFTSNIIQDNLNFTYWCLIGLSLSIFKNIKVDK